MDGDSIMEDAVLYLEEKRYRADCPPNRKRAIRKKCKKLKLDHGEILYEKKLGQVSYTVSQKVNAFMIQWVKYIKSLDERQRIMRFCHCDPTSGHLGEKKTYHRIIERYTWKGIMKCVKEMVLQFFVS